jgi:choline/glycine/proline betaine transport protein
MTGTPPVSETEPSSAETAPSAQPHANKPVLIGSAAVILAIALWAIIAPTQAGNVIGAIVGWVSKNLGWYYIMTAAIVVFFVIMLAVRREGSIKLGPDHSKPQFNMFTWTSMLFAAGIGIDLMFFSVSEPVTQYYTPPDGAGENLEAAQQSVVWALFHYGPVGWSMYALFGGAFAYFAYRRNMPLSIRSLLSPLLGKKLDGWAGHTVDIAAVLGTVFGIATSLGIGVVQLNYGLHLMFGLPEGVGAQIGLIVLSVAMATMSTLSGVEKGIRRLSELNVILALVLLVWIAVTGNTRRVLDGLVMNVGDFISTFPGRLMNTFTWIQPDDWNAAWTLFFWAWWIAWAPFVGLFLARISRGRTLRQFIVGVLAVPFAFITLFMSVFGNSALELVIGGNDKFGQSAMNTPERAFYDLIAQYPGAPFLIGLATVTGLLFYVTSADSGALVLSNFTSTIKDPKQDGAKPLRLFWSVVTGLLTMAMLIVGGVTTLQGATLIIGLPFSVVMYLVMISLWRALRAESNHRDGFTRTLTARTATAEPNWQHRLRRAMSYPQRPATEKYLDTVAAPALEAVAGEMREAGADVTVDRREVDGYELPCLLLRVDLGQPEDFNYQIQPVAQPMPGFGYITSPGSDQYFRLEVFTATGSRGYDMFGYSREHLIADVLDLYESHLEYLRLADGEPDASVPSPVLTDWHEDLPPFTARTDHTDPSDEAPETPHP